MENEKVKAIKKALQFQRDGLMYLENNCVEVVYCKDILILINELESKNKKLKQHKRELEGGQQDLLKVIKEFYKETQQLKDRIIELENKNKELAQAGKRVTEINQELINICKYAKLDIVKCDTTEKANIIWNLPQGNEPRIMVEKPKFNPNAWVCDCEDDSEPMAMPNPQPYIITK